MELRPPQLSACKAVYKDLKTEDAVLCVLATGVGKTIVASSLTNVWKSEGKRVLFLAHRDELISQAADKMLKARGIIAEIEKASSYASKDASVVIGSVQSMQEDRLRSWDSNSFDYIIVDEAHRSTAQTYLNIFDHFSSAKLLGLTATAYRKKGDLKNVYRKISYEYNLRQAIQDGYLCRIVAVTVPISIDISGVRSNAGDFNDEDLSNSIEPFFIPIIDKIIEMASDRKTVVFLPLVSTSKLFCNMLREKGLQAFHADGFDRSGLREFEATEGPSILCNSSLLTEGYDNPSINCIIDLAPTKSTSRYSQKIGRGTRLLEGKSDCLVIDFLWNSADHDLCRPACLIAETEEIEQEMTEVINSKPKPVDLIQEAEVEAVVNIREKREKKLAERLMMLSDRRSKTFDPVIESLSIFDDRITKYTPHFGWESSDMTQFQKETLKQHGFKTDGWSRGYADIVITDIEKRRRMGLCSPRQMRKLLSHGYADASSMTAQDASALMDKLGKQWYHINKNKRKGK